MLCHKKLHKKFFQHFHMELTRKIYMVYFIFYKTLREVTDFTCFLLIFRNYISPIHKVKHNLSAEQRKDNLIKH